MHLRPVDIAHPAGSCRGASTTGLVAGLALILVFLAAGLSILTRRRHAPGTDTAAWAAIPPPPPPRGSSARRRPAPKAPLPSHPPLHPAPDLDGLPERAPDDVPTAPPDPSAGLDRRVFFTKDGDDAPPVPSAVVEAPVEAPMRFSPPPDRPTPSEPGAKVPEVEAPVATPSQPDVAPLVPTPPSAPPRPVVPPPVEGPIGPPPFMASLAGPGAEDVATAATRLAHEGDLLTRRAQPLGFAVRGRSSAAGSGAERSEGDAVAIDLEGTALILRRAPAIEPGPDPTADLVPPIRLLGPLLTDVRLPVPADRRADAVTALLALLGDDPASAARLLDAALSGLGDDAASATGLRLLRGAAALAALDLPKVHGATFGLSTDPALGPVARVLTGAALRADRNPPEAMRDFEAALVARPELWVARLLLAETYETDELRFGDRAAEAYAAVLVLAPDEPAAVVGLAAARARTAPVEARAHLERLLARRPGIAAAWRLLAWVRASGGTSEDHQAAVAALERAVALVPDDPTAWAELGGARWRWSSAGGGRPAVLAAADAYARQTDLAPADGTAWFRRGAAIHQAALDGPVEPESLRTRLLEAKACYLRALALGLARDEAARVHFNVGLVHEYAPAGTAASAAYDAALAADATYLPAGFALVAARVAERDGGAAQRALDRLPPAVEDASREERAVLEAAVAWARNDLARVPVALSSAGVAAVGTDPVPALARSLLVLGYRRAALAVLSGETRDTVRLSLRVRAHAGLRDASATQSEWDRLLAADATVAAAVRREPEVAATLTR